MLRTIQAITAPSSTADAITTTSPRRQRRSSARSFDRLTIGISTWLNGEALFSGLYLNELLIRLLPAEDPHPGVFDHYAETLLALAEGRALEPLLRSFEWRLLDDLGYGFSLTTDSHDQSIAPDGLSRLHVDAGLERVYLLQPGLFNGTELLAMAEADWSAPGALSAAKRLMRQALAVHLGGRPLVSRELFRKP